MITTIIKTNDEDEMKCQMKCHVIDSYNIMQNAH